MNTGGIFIFIGILEIIISSFIFQFYLIMGRPPKCKIIDICLEHNEFVSNSNSSSQTIILSSEELQAIKLKDIDHLNCIEGAEKMGISKSTFANLYNKAHQKITNALINGYKIKFKC